MPNPECEKFCPFIKTCNERRALLEDYKFQLGSTAMALDQGASSEEGAPLSYKQEALKVIAAADKEIEKVNLHETVVVDVADCQGPKRRKKYMFFGEVIYKCASNAYNPEHHDAMLIANQEQRSTSVMDAFE